MVRGHGDKVRGQCSTIGCQRDAGTSVVRHAATADGLEALGFEALPDEPVCDPCARFYAALDSLDFAVIDTTEVPA